MNNVEWGPVSEGALRAQKIEYGLFTNVHFRGMKRVLDVYEVTGPLGLNLNNVTFDGGRIGLWARNVPKVVYTNGCNLMAGPGAQYGIRLESVPSFTFRNSTASGFPADVNRQYAAMHLTDVRFARIRESIVSENDLAIVAPAAGLVNKTNVVVTEGSQINDSRIGILLERGGVGTTNQGGTLHFGMVEMRCSELRNNRTGIEGRDVLLHLDGFSGDIGGDTEPTPQANIFEVPIGAGPLIFDIELDAYANNPELMASGNYCTGRVTSTVPIRCPAASFRSTTQIFSTPLIFLISLLPHPKSATVPNRPSPIPPLTIPRPAPNLPDWTIKSTASSPSTTKNG